jgi:hypothetical protein
MQVKAVSSCLTVATVAAVDNTYIHAPTTFPTRQDCWRCQDVLYLLAFDGTEGVVCTVFIHCFCISRVRPKGGQLQLLQPTASVTCHIEGLA